MNAGLVEQLAGPREIYERPATAFVAGFIGTSNLLTGTATGGELKIGGGRVLVPGHEGDVTVTVRPEKITIDTEAPADGVSSVRGTVAEVVYLGTYNSYAVSLADGGGPTGRGEGADRTQRGTRDDHAAASGETIITVFQQNANDATATAERGDSVWLSWQAQHSYVIGS
jgi:spermidine/putrescine transport system ATP-binding protein